MQIPVSVIIPYYNGSKFIENTLNSVFNQTVSPLEIIIVDDGSTKKESNILDQYIDRVKVIKQANTGVSAARNTAISESHGEWVAFLDQDDLWQTTKLEKQWEFIQKNPNSKAIHTAVLAIKEDGREVEYKKKALMLDDFLDAHPNPSYLSSTFINKKLILKAGLFNPILDYSQDLDLFLRCSQYCTFDYIDEALTTRINHDANLSGNAMGVWHENILISRMYKRLFKSETHYLKKAYRLHLAYGLSAIRAKDINGLKVILHDLNNDRFSQIVFIYRILKLLLLK